MPRYAIGLDYGTNSCRSLLLDIDTGEELGSSVFDYPSGDHGVITDPADPNLARQNPRDHLEGLAAVVRGALEAAAAARPGFDPAEVVGLGVDTTGSTPLPVDEKGQPLCFDPRFSGNPHAQIWLWKDHTAHAEAAEITALAAEIRPRYLARCGGTYSSEWWWSKILRCRRAAPEVFGAAHSWVEHCDWLPAVLTGVQRPEDILRSVCAAGHKALYAEEWGGLPDEEFLARLDPALAELRPRLYSGAHPSGIRAGGLSPEWAGKLGLPPGIAVSVGAFDAHMGAVGAGVKAGTFVKILGTSTCDITVAGPGESMEELPGVCGFVDGSVLPGQIGIEAGQSAVGDIFLWFVNHLVPESYGTTREEKFAAMEGEMAALKPGETGLMALDWNNGNRTILTDALLTGLLLGQTLHTRAHEIYRALIEATAYGARAIIERMEEYGVRIDEVVNTGGLAVKNPTLMQIYADVIGKPLKVAASDQTCALGAALFGAVAAGASGIAELQANCCRVREQSYRPDPADRAVYDELYAIYRQLHDGFGTQEWSGSMGQVMKQLIAIRQRQRG